jgi:hypothetical protein
MFTFFPFYQVFAPFFIWYHFDDEDFEEKENDAVQFVKYLIMYGEVEGDTILTLKKKEDSTIEAPRPPPPY